MADPYLGEIRMFAGTFAPRGWLFCEGQLLPIAENVALFAVIGTTYGGDGQTTFALPDLRDRTPVHDGQGPGLTERVLGQAFGTAEVTLLLENLPAHTHGLRGAASAGSTPNPNQGVAAHGLAPLFAAAADGEMGRLAAAGGDQPHDNRPPTLTMNFILATEGIFPAFD